MSGSALVDTSCGIGGEAGGASGVNADIHEVIVVAGASAGDLTNIRAYLAARVALGTVYT